MRTDWTEREDRLAWETRWTVVGGRYRSETDDLGAVSEKLRLPVERSLSQVFIALSPPRSDPHPAVLHWASVIRKIVQRGERPPVGIDDPANTLLSESTIVSVLAKCDGATKVEPDVDRLFDHDNERDAWTMFGATAPHLQRWTLPQAGIQSLVGETEGERWADFLVAAPWATSTVLELDGRQHQEAATYDRARDRALKSVGVHVERTVSGVAASPDGKLAARFSSAPTPAQPSNENAEYLLLPAAIHRLLYGLAEIAERGFVDVGSNDWSIELDHTFKDPAILIDQALSVAAAIEDTWDIEVMPKRIWFNTDLWLRSKHGYKLKRTSEGAPAADARISLEPFTNPVALLPDPDEIPSVVFRSTHLPVDLAWTSTTSTHRANRTRNKRTDRGLEVVLKYLFSFDTYREAQLESISRVLSGGDAMVLLPTGAGKTLIYQIAGLLRPGTTIVIAPLKSLIDDQERRLRDDGISRTVAIHSGKGLAGSDKSLLHDSIGNGEALFVIIAPERLQIDGFRHGLTEAAQSHMVNLAVIDEAHCVSEWGHQFRTSYLRLGHNLRRFSTSADGSSPPVLALTATAGPAVLRDLAVDIGFDLQEPGLLHKPKTFRRPNLEYHIHQATPADRKTAFAQVIKDTTAFLDTHPPAPGSNLIRAGLVFTPWVNSAHGVLEYRDALAGALGVTPAQIAVYSGRQPKDDNHVDWDSFKADGINAFRTGTKPNMVATSAFGMGIDIPNIRYAIHVGMPGSLEAYAQESGRAGRDKQPSICTLIAVPTTPVKIEALLAPASPTRRDSFEKANAGFQKPTTKDDADIRLYFHYQGFPDIPNEVADAMSVYEDLMESGGPGTSHAVIPRTRTGRSDTAAAKRERGLHRLALLGVVADYTIEYQASTFTVDVAPYDIATLERNFVDYIGRILADEGPAQQWLRTQHDSEHGRVQHLVEGIVALAQTTIERGRLEALTEMHRVVTDGLSSEQIHDRIDSYLGAGQVAALLDRVVSDTTFSMTEVLERLDSAPPATSEDWAGAGARYAESYPDHPVVSLVRAVGEAWRTSADEATFDRLLTNTFESLSSDHASEYDNTARWVLKQLRTRTTFGDRSAWTKNVWNIIDITNPPAGVVDDIENEVLDIAVSDNDPSIQLDNAEVAHILERRIGRATDRLRPIMYELRRAS